MYACLLEGNHVGPSLTGLDAPLTFKIMNVEVLQVLCVWSGNFKISNKRFVDSSDYFV